MSDLFKGWENVRLYSVESASLMHVLNTLSERVTCNYPVSDARITDCTCDARGFDLCRVQISFIDRTPHTDVEGEMYFCLASRKNIKH